MTATSKAIPQSADASEWASWQPTHRATLLFAISGDHILLIRKKRGLGAGKINGPGGKLEEGESPIECARREIAEELRVEARGVTECGELSFQFTNGYSIFVTVFRAEGIDGEPIETDEAVPLWTPMDQIPYDEMWADDELWLPALIAGRRFSGRFVFDGDRMVDHHLDGVECPD